MSAKQGQVNDTVASSLLPPAALWDMDGVLVESGHFHFQAWSRLCREQGKMLTEEMFRVTFGQRNDFILRQWFGEEMPTGTIRRLGDLKEVYYREAVTGHVEPLPGAMELLQALKASGFRCAVASAAPPANIRLILRELRAERLFDAVVTAEDVTKGKPDPEVYLLAAQRVGVPASRCVVLEDAVAGVEGAKAAGMACIGVASNHLPAALAKADLVVGDLTAVTPMTLLALLNATQ